MLLLIKMNNKTRLTIEIDSPLKHEVKCKAYEEGKTIREKIIQLINEWLKR